MVSEETLLSYLHQTISFTVHTDASDKQFGDVIIQNNKPIYFFSRVPRKPQSNYTRTEKEILTIVEWLKLFHGIIFGHEINAFQIIKSGLCRNPEWISKDHVLSTHSWRVWA